MRKLYVLATLLFASVAPSIAAEPVFTMKSINRPSAEVNPGDVYGVVRYTVQDFKSEERVESLIERLGSLLGSAKEGDYILTLEIRKPDDSVVAREALLHFKITERRFLIVIRTSYEEMTKRQWRGDLVRDVVVRDDNNTLKVALVTYFSEKNTIDWSLFNSLLKLGNQAGVIGLNIATGPVKDTWDSVQVLVGQILNNYTKQDITDAFDMSFTRLGGVNSDNTVDVQTPFRTRRSQGDVFIRINFLTMPSKIGNFDVKKGQFTRLNRHAYTRNARVGTKSIDDYLKNHEENDVRNFATAIASDSGYTGDNIGTRCEQVVQAFHQTFSNRDAKLIFWAWLFEKEEKLRKNTNYDNCLRDDVRADFTTLGLPHDNLLRKPAS